MLMGLDPTRLRKTNFCQATVHRRKAHLIYDVGWDSWVVQGGSVGWLWGSFLTFNINTNSASKC